MLTVDRNHLLRLLTFYLCGGGANFRIFIYTWYIYVAMRNTDTMIRISKRVRDGLKEKGKKGETYDEILERLLEQEKV